MLEESRRGGRWEEWVRVGLVQGVADADIGCAAEAGIPVGAVEGTADVEAHLGKPGVVPSHVPPHANMAWVAAAAS